jgi:hypothetical protein
MIGIKLAFLLGAGILLSAFADDIGQEVFRVIVIYLS